MAQLIVRNLDDDVRDKLRTLASEHGRSMEEEVREILRAATLGSSLTKRLGLGSRLAHRFRDFGLDEEIPEVRGHAAKPADLTQ